jgi:hypothetical protein
MKKTYVLIAIAVSAIGFTTSASAQTSATGEMTSTATLIKPITITTGALMTFGTLTTGTAGGSVTFTSASDGAAFAPTLNAVFALNSTPTAATFTVSGEAGSTFAITLPGSAQELSSGVETIKLSLSDFKHNLIATPTLDGLGQKVFQVAATLTIPASTVSGNYTSAAIPVTVNYN